MPTLRGRSGMLSKNWNQAGKPSSLPEEQERLKGNEMTTQNMPGFTAGVTLYKTNNCYQVAAVLAAETAGRISAAVLKGTFCTVRDPNCASGFSKIRCTGFDADSCTETGECCTPPRGGGGGQSRNCGTHSCATEPQCCGLGCCPTGTHCCSGTTGCCPNDRTCRSIFGQHFCSPI